MKKRHFCFALSVLLLASGCGKQADGIPAAQESDREIYLFTQGWKGHQTAARTVTIPAADDPALAEYGALQEVQGLPLLSHAGEEGMCYTYELSQSDLYAELLTADGILVGAMCYDPESGEMFGIGGK